MNRCRDRWVESQVIERDPLRLCTSCQERSSPLRLRGNPVGPDSRIRNS